MGPARLGVEENWAKEALVSTSRAAVVGVGQAVGVAVELLMAHLRVRRGTGHPRTRPAAVRGDKAYL